MAELVPYSGSFGASGTFGEFPVQSRSGEPAGSEYVTAGDAITNYAGFPSQQTVTQGYVARPWKDSASNKNLKVGNLLFGARSMPDKRGNTVAFLNLWQMNHQLSKLYQRGMAVMNGVGDSTESYKNIMRSMDILKERSEDNWMDGSVDDIWSTLKNSQAGQILKHMTLKGITDHFNVVGVVVAHGDESTVFRGVTLGVNGVTYVDNVWGVDAVGSAALWLILKRVFIPNTGTYGQFQYVPYVTKHDPAPPMSQRAYRDTSDNLQYGDCIYIGEVLEQPKKIPRETERLKAAGLIGTNDDGYIASGTIPRVKIIYSAMSGRQNRVH